MSNIYIRLFSIFCVISFNGLFGQNLLVNGGLEAHTQCPQNFISLDAVLDQVSTPTTSSGDYFHSCNTNDFNVPNNFKGTQVAVEGTAYVGLYFYALNDYREYVQLNTSQTLRENYPYEIEIKVSRAETSTVALKNMSVVFANKALKRDNSAALTKNRLSRETDFEYHEVLLASDGSLEDTEEWITLKGRFEAKGFESHMVIGNFKDNAHTALLNQTKSLVPSDFSYYFVDGCTLTALPKTNYEKDKIYVLEQNPFAPKGYKLDALAISNIRKIFKHLKANAELQLKITGHSHDAGSTAYNKFVSSLRARAVALYLRKLGINDDRIVWEGVGDTQPIRTQEEAGARSVEFVMTNFEDK
ncbi:MAG: OmpA family protein [Bacteroidota bacterium]